MTPIELAASIAAIVLAIARLLNAAQFAWSWLPKNWQPVLPAVVIALPQFAGALGLVETKMDIAVAALLAIGSVVAAIRGQAAAPAVILLGLSLSVGACAGAKPVLATIEQAGAVLCQADPARKREAEARGISLEQVCAVYAALYRTEATRAQERVGRALPRGGP
jgi:hypothetical protein